MKINKIISFPDQETKDRAEALAKAAGMTLKRWIEQLILDKVGYKKRKPPIK